MHLRRDQSGVGSVEVFLIIVVVALAGVVGWLVYDRQDNKDSVVQSNSQTSEESSRPTQSYLTVSEWNIKIPLSDQFKDTTYRYEDGYVYVENTNVGGESSIGSFSRYKIGEKYDSFENQVTTTRTFTQSDVDDSPDTYTKLGDYYYMFASSQMKLSDKGSQLRDELVKNRMKIEAIE